MLKKGKDFLTLLDIDSEELGKILYLTEKVKKKDISQYKNILSGKNIGMIFEKPSTRTRVSFEVAISKLNGKSLYLSSRDLQLKRGETISDTAKTLSRYLDGIVIRAYSHSDVEELANNASIPVINALTDMYHPCQALADLFTIKEKKGEIKNVKIGYLGDGNNVCHSLMIGAVMSGADINIACPHGYEPETEVYEAAKEVADNNKCKITITYDPKIAALDSDVIYTDVWVSMGQEESREEKERAFSPFQVNQNIMSIAKDDAIFMHCLPAHRGEEVISEVIDGESSVVFDQAENRLHTQIALLIYMWS
ncbi:MAG: ornithine carbamoyltransferase [Candidatus Humimicrobiia bacterium]